MLTPNTEQNETDIKPGFWTPANAARIALTSEISAFVIVVHLMFSGLGRHVRTGLISFFLISLASFFLCIRAARTEGRDRIRLPLIAAAIAIFPILLFMTIRAMGGIRYGH